VVALAGELVGHPKNGVCDAVHVGWERFGDDRDPHAHKVRYVGIRTHHLAVTCKRSFGDILERLAARRARSASGQLAVPGEARA
jgi:hypothetical protein